MASVGYPTDVDETVRSSRDQHQSRHAFDLFSHEVDFPARTAAAFARNMRDRLEDQGLSEQDIQAVMWYYEQKLMTDLGVQSRPGAFSEEAGKIYEQLRPGVRGSDATEAAAESGSLTGFRGVSPTQRTVRAERRLSERLDRSDLGGQAGPYARGAGSGDAGDGLLVLEPNVRRDVKTLAMRYTRSLVP